MMKQQTTTLRAIATLLLAALFSANSLSAQLGGQGAYPFLKLPVSARATALGGAPIVSFDEDVALAALNPALLNPRAHNRISFQQQFLFEGINHSSVSYARNINRWGVMAHGGMQFVRYGNIEATDEQGNLTGNTFTAGDFSVYTGASRRLSEHLSVGANLRFIQSRLEQYNSIGATADIAGLYRDTAKRFTATLLFRHAGGQITTYADDRRAAPYEVMFGVSKRLKHLPFRFSIIGQNLQRWDVRYDDPNAVPVTNLFGEVETGPSEFSKGVDNLFRHLIFGGEFLLGAQENFRINFAYNHLRRRELSLDQYRSASGFSAGFSLKINRFRFEYGWGSYHLAGASHHIGLSTDLDDFLKKKSI